MSVAVTPSVPQRATEVKPVMLPLARLPVNAALVQRLQQNGKDLVCGHCRRSLLDDAKPFRLGRGKAYGEHEEQLYTVCCGCADYQCSVVTREVSG